MNWYRRYKTAANQGEYRSPGDVLWFEYHCYEGHDSGDAEVWYRSHQKVTVLKLEEEGYGATLEERGENAQPAVYTVRFEDGFEYDVFEDELVDSPSEFYRPDPPPRPEVKQSAAEGVATTSPASGMSVSVPMSEEITPGNIYTRYDVIQERDDLAPSRLKKKRRRKKKKRKADSRNWYRVAKLYNAEILSHHDFVGFHCQDHMRSPYDDRIPLDEDYAEAYYVEVLDALPFNLRDGAMKEGLFEKPERYSKKFDSWADKVHQFFEANDVKWIFVSETRPLTDQYGEYCYYVLLPSSKIFGSMPDPNVDDLATAYMYIGSEGGPVCIEIPEDEDGYED